MVNENSNLVRLLPRKGTVGSIKPSPRNVLLLVLASLVFLAVSACGDADSADSERLARLEATVDQLTGESNQAFGNVVGRIADLEAVTATLQANESRIAALEDRTRVLEQRLNSFDSPEPTLRFHGERLNALQRSIDRLEDRADDTELIFRQLADGLSEDPYQTSDSEWLLLSAICIVLGLPIC